ncbi:hypothetical protein Dimus_007240 [Dionaea muscipula]
MRVDYISVKLRSKRRHIRERDILSRRFDQSQGIMVGYKRPWEEGGRLTGLGCEVAVNRPWCKKMSVKSGGGDRYIVQEIWTILHVRDLDHLACRGVNEV